MASSIPELVYRVYAVLGKYKEWFDAVAQWYGNAKTTKKVLVDLWTPSARSTCRLVLSVNGQFLDGGALDRASTSRRLFWKVPPSALRKGDNDIALWLDRQDGPSLAFGAVTVEQAASSNDARPEPQATSQVSVAYRLGEGFRSDVDVWSTQTQHDTLKLHLRLAHQVPGSLSVDVTALLPAAGPTLNFQVLWELVEDAVKDKIKELGEELIRLERERHGRYRVVKEQLEDLRAYQKLHRLHLAEAKTAKDSATLDDIIARTEEPAQVELVRGQKGVPVPKRVSLLPRLLLLLALLMVAVVLAWYNAWIQVPVLDRVAAAWKNAQGQPNGGALPQQQKQEIDQLLQAKGAQTGDVQISLFWANKNDLDLQVVCPSGERIFWGHRQSKCQGKHDIDMNVHYDRASAKAIENIYWPQGQAPRGRYKILVTHFRNHGRPDCQDPTPFTVRTVVRGTTRWFNGEVVHGDPARREAVVHELDVN
jgi:hypothetical protein